MPLQNLMRKYLIITLLFPLLGFAQVSSVSPYTLFGIGDLSEGYFLRNISMGGTGIALRDPIFMNLSNPASYSSLELTTLEIGLTHRFINQTDNKTGTSVENQSTFFHYFGLGFKFTEKWGFGVSLTPYSKVGYNIFTEEEVDGFGDTRYTFKGEGGIDQIVVGTSYEILKNLSLGANLRYLFGSTDRSTSAEFYDGSFFNSKRNTRTRVADVIFDFGAQYTLDSINNKYDLTLGAIYNSQSSIKTYRSYVDYTFNYINGVENQKDTLSFIQDQRGETILPAKFGGGLTYGKRDNRIYSYSWLIAADFSTTLWSQYRNYDEEGGLNDSWRVSVGGYFIPGFAFNQNTGRRSYMSQVEWRLGGFYENSNVLVDNTPVTVYGASLGWSFPFRPRNLAPGDAKLNNFSFGIVVGSKGAESDNIIKEDFINLTFGITLNDMWFQKRKYR